MSETAVRYYFKLVLRHHLCLQILAEAGQVRGKSEDVSGWVVTLHFYVLCAYLKSIGRCCGQDFQDHYAIRQWMNSIEDVQYLYRHYRKAEEWSRNARYEGHTFTRHQIEDRLHTWFKLVRDGVVSQLRKRGFADMPEVEPVSIA